MTPQLRNPAPQTPPDQDEMVKVSLTIPRSDVQKLHAFMQSDTYEQTQALRREDAEQGRASLTHCVEMALQDHGGARVMAQFLCSLYNGNRVKADVSGIGTLDMANFEHLMNALRLCYQQHSEPHEFFVDGGALFERIIKDWGFEKRRRS